MYGYIMGPLVIQTPDMDSVRDRKELREDLYTKEDNINLNTNNQEDTKVNPVLILSDQQVEHV
jgi:hypothetical protein